MGYTYYEVWHTGRGETIEAGYGVEDVCWQADCLIEIDRGMDFLCGEMPGGDEYGCGGYFCGTHMDATSDGTGGYISVCLTCAKIRQASHE